MWLFHLNIRINYTGTCTCTSALPFLLCVFLPLSLFLKLLYHVNIALRVPHRKTSVAPSPFLFSPSLSPSLWYSLFPSSSHITLVHCAISRSLPSNFAGSLSLYSPPPLSTSHITQEHCLTRATSRNLSCACNDFTVHSAKPLLCVHRLKSPPPSLGRALPYLLHSKVDPRAELK